MNITEQISEVQSALSRDKIVLNMPGGNKPMIELLGGIHARATINKTRPNRFPNTTEEFETAKKLINLLAK